MFEKISQKLSSDVSSFFEEKTEFFLVLAVLVYVAKRVISKQSTTSTTQRENR